MNNKTKSRKFIYVSIEPIQPLLKRLRDDDNFHHITIQDYTQEHGWRGLARIWSENTNRSYENCLTYLERISAGRYQTIRDDIVDEICIHILDMQMELLYEGVL